MHTAPAHLESKLRFWDFTVGQIAAAFAGIMLGCRVGEVRLAAARDAGAR